MSNLRDQFEARFDRQAVVYGRNGTQFVVHVGPPIHVDALHYFFHYELTPCARPLRDVGVESLDELFSLAVEKKESEKRLRRLAIAAVFVVFVVAIGIGWLV